MWAFLINPDRFMAFSRWALPTLAAVAAALWLAGLTMANGAAPDYQQGLTVQIMFIHVPAAWVAMLSYVCLGGASFLGLVFRLPMAHLAARACAPLGATFTALALITGALWGRPMWGAWWVWDARLTSVLILLLFFLGYIALRSSLDDESRAERAAAILALVGLINLPVIRFSVEWWNTLHQGASVFRKGGSSLDPSYLYPLLVMGLAYTATFGALWLLWCRAEVWRSRAIRRQVRNSDGA